MKTQELALKPITELAPLVQKREVSPVHLVEAYLQQIERHDEHLRAYITVCAESAREEAKKAEQEIVCGQYRGPLHGMAIGLKDQFFTKGIKTTGGSKILASFVPDEDATVVKRLKEAGAIIIGKHNQAEFALGGTREHPYGTPRNPWAPDRIPGHSSSGSGVAVAASMCTAALGEDTGGSGRIPGAACGIVALRPTYGRISRYGTMPVCWSMDCASPMAKTVEDCAILLQCIAGHDPKDQMSSKRDVPDYRKGLRDGVKAMRIGVINELHPPESAHGDVKRLFAEAVKKFEELGAQVEEVSVPLITLAAPFFVAICDTDAAFVHYDLLRSRAMDYDSATRARLMSASLVSAGIYNKAMQARNLLRNQMLHALGKVDALLSPMSYGPTPVIGEENPVFDSKESVIKQQFGARSFTTPQALAALPGLTVPCGFTSVGVPMGLQITGRAFEEETVLRVAAAYEAATDWHTRRPNL